jgi:hypothetical protein
VSTSLPSTVEAAESPELTILYALHATVSAAERALLAAHPELEEVDLSAELLPISPMACTADLLLLHLVGVVGAINRYTAQLRRASAIGHNGGEF